MSSSSPVGPFNPWFDPTIQSGFSGLDPTDFATVFKRGHDHDCDPDWPFEGSQGYGDGSSFPSGREPGLPPGWGLDPPWGSDPDGPGQGGSGDDGCQPEGGGHLTVNGDTISDGEYTIDASTADSGTITVTDKNNPTETFKVWGDPHITTGAGGTANFQHAPVTFKLPDGTQITVTPTDNPGVNTIEDVTVTSGNDAATITGFTTGHLQTDLLPGQGRRLDAATPDGTVLHAKDGNINDLVVANGGPEIFKKLKPSDPNYDPNIDRYATLSVGGPNDDTIYDGRYTIVASNADKGTLTVTDNVTHETFTVWGDPHITTDKGGTANFQHAPATFVLPDGTEITVTPTDNPGVNTISNVTITKRNDAVTITGFGSGGHPKVENRPGEGYWLDATTWHGTVLHTTNGNIDDLVVGNGGPEISKKLNPKDPNYDPNIDRYAGPRPPRCFPPFPYFPLDFDPIELALLQPLDGDSPTFGGYQPESWWLPEAF
jgi:hypothetical protein